MKRSEQGYYPTGRTLAQPKESLCFKSNTGFTLKLQNND
jgi:hypothetical protein